MPIHHALWIVADDPVEVKVSALSSERQLEDMIVAEPRILSEEWMLIGRQEDTGTGGRVDLLAIAPDASLVLIELKRNKTPRDVITQTLDYASWLTELKAEDVSTIYGRFKPGASLTEDFQTRFGHVLDEEMINGAHQLVVVASTMDPHTERIVRYLEAWDVPINVLFFEVFEHGDMRFLSRAWLLDPVDVQVNASPAVRGKKEPWTGEFYACFGHGDERQWDEAVKHGFISAGGGSWYTNTLKSLHRGDRVWVKAPNYGFVGVGRVIGPRQSATEYEIGGRPALEVLEANYHRQYRDNTRMEYFVPVSWLETVPLDRAVHEVGMFGNQNTVCKPRDPKWRRTVDSLKRVFPGFKD